MARSDATQPAPLDAAGRATRARGELDIADFTIRWNDWRGGDFGRLDPARANGNQFRGHNVLVYRSGLLGPRAGFKVRSVTGLPTAPTANGPNGFDVFGDRIVIGIDKLYDFAMSTGNVAVTPYTAYPSGVVGEIHLLRGDNNLYSVMNGKLYRHLAHGTTLITTPVDFSLVVRWGLFMVAIDKNIPWRIYFSAVDSAGPHFDQWPANNYLDVGNTDPITTLNPIFNTLYCGKTSGWWAVSGVLGNLASVRQVTVANGPIDHRFVSVTSDNRVIYWPVEKSPTWFNGERTYIDELFTLDTRTLPFLGHTVIVTPTGRSLILCGEDAATAATDFLMWRDSAWTFHSTPFLLGAMAPADVEAAAQMPEGVLYACQRPTQVGAPTRIFTWQHDLDRPSHLNDGWSHPMDDGDTDLVQGQVDFPAWFDGQGRQCRLRSLIVQFRKWDSGLDTVNQIAVTVDALGPWESGLRQVEPQRWSESSDVAEPGGSAGRPDSWRINFGDQGFANGFQIRFPVLRGVALQEVIALVDFRKERT